MPVNRTADIGGEDLQIMQRIPIMATRSIASAEKTLEVADFQKLLRPRPLLAVLLHLVSAHTSLPAY
jgi:hypothetical protein